MLKFTLDTNCLIDIDEERPAAVHIRHLIKSAESGASSVALVASSASERQKSGQFLSNFATFNDRRSELGFGAFDLLPSIGRWDVSFFDKSLRGGDESIARETQIYITLFPSFPIKWNDYANAKSAEVENKNSPEFFRWRNKLLDAQAFWAHEHAQRDIFVTSDRRFKHLNGHPDFPQADVQTPEEAASSFLGWSEKQEN